MALPQCLIYNEILMLLLMLGSSYEKTCFQSDSSCAQIAVSFLLGHIYIMNLWPKFIPKQSKLFHKDKKCSPTFCCKHCYISSKQIIALNCVPLWHIFFINIRFKILTPQLRNAVLGSLDFKWPVKLQWRVVCTKYPARWVFNRYYKAHLTYWKCFLFWNIVIEMGY